MRISFCSLLPIRLCPNCGNEGLFWLSEIKKADEELPVVLFTAYADIDLAVKALKGGATDFVVNTGENGTGKELPSLW